MLIRQTKSKNTSESMKQRELSDKYTKYLRSPYSEDAIKSIERSILHKYVDVEPPVELHKLFLEAAKYYIENDMYEEANKVLDSIMESRNLTIAMQARIERDLIKVKQSAENGEINQDTLDDIKSIVKNDEEHELDTAQPGKFTEYDVLTSYFQDIPIEMVNEDIFPSNLSKPGTGRVPNPTPNPSPDIPRNTKYKEELSAKKRLEFLKDHFPIERVRIGKNSFMGTIIFEIKDSNLVIAENFYKMDRYGNCSEDYGKATYIIPKEAELDLIQLSRGELREKGKQGSMKFVEHYGNYYDNLIEKFNTLQSGMSKKVDGNTYSPNDTEAENSEQTNNENKKQQFMQENEIFLNNLNVNIDNIISPDIMQGLLNRASYSFENLYNKKLKKEIIDRLEVLEIPEEQREIEAQKVFLYMRMTKNISLINRGTIRGKQLNDVLDLSVLEYQYAMDFFAKHKDDGLTYSQLVKGIKEYVETRRDIFESKKTTKEDKKQEETETPSTINEDVKDGQEASYNTLVGDEIPEQKRTKAMDMAIKFTEILERYQQVSKKIERANFILAEKRKEYDKAVQETAEARKLEEMAKKATSQAMEQEESAQKEMEGAQNEAEQLKKEQEDLQRKISQIEDLLQ